MPTINTLGVTSARAYGFGVSSGGGFGTLAIFGIGSPSPASTSLTNKYVFSSAVVTSGTNFVNQVVEGSAAGTGFNGIFLSGSYSTGNKYNYASDACVSVTGANMRGGSAAGNKTVGIFTAGFASVSPYADPSGYGFYVSGARYKYTYSSDSIATATTSSNYGSYGSAAGVLAFGIFQIGAYDLWNGVNTTTREKYTYSSDVITPATSATASNYQSYATGNSTVGIFLNDGGSANKYSYSSDSNVANPPITGANGAAAGNDFVGIFQGGSAGINYTYTYASSSTTSATAIAYGYLKTGASNGTTGVNI